MRHGAVGSTMPALRAALRCSRFAGSRRTRFAQTAASPDPRNAALLGGTEGPPAPRRMPGAGRDVEAACPHPGPLPGREGGSRGMHYRSDRGDGGCALGRPLRHRRAAQRRADQGSPLSERSEFGRDPARREQRREAAKRPVTSAAQGHSPRRRAPNTNSDPFTAQDRPRSRAHRTALRPTCLERAPIHRTARSRSRKWCG